MRTKAIMITGAAGEIGHALIKALSEQNIPLLTLDLVDLPVDVQGLSTHIQGDILDESLLARLISEYEFEYCHRGWRDRRQPRGHQFCAVRTPGVDL